MNIKLVLACASIVTAFLVTNYYSYTTDQSNHHSAPQADLDCGFNQDFAKFISDNGYSNFGFERPEIKCGSYGGRSSSKQPINKVPVIFIHGNSDVGFGRGSLDGYAAWQTGFRWLATYLSGKGYQKSEMYTITWGSADPNKASFNTHNKELILRMRAFVEAVIKYTGAPKINIVGHSMGVTIALISRSETKQGQIYIHGCDFYYCNTNYIVSSTQIQIIIKTVEQVMNGIFIQL